MQSVVDIEEFKKLIEGGKWNEACNILPIDISHLALLIHTLHQLDAPLAICWLQCLLRNPFPFAQFLCKEEIVKVAEYLMEKRISEAANYGLMKIVLLDISLLMARISECWRKDELIDYSHGKCYLFSKDVSSFQFFTVLTELTKIGEARLVLGSHGQNPMGNAVPTGTSGDRLVLFNSDQFSFDISGLLSWDSSDAAPERIKLVGYLAKPETAAYCFNLLVKLLLNNRSSGAIGPISKAILRASRFLDRNELVDSLIKILGNEIFGNEYHWIGVMTTLGLMLLEGAVITDLSFVEVALKQRGEFQFQGIALLETALFLIWCWVRGPAGMGKVLGCGGNVLENCEHVIRILNAPVFIALFDTAIVCRRAAVPVVEEILGRCSLEMVALLYGTSTPLFNITQAAVVRLESCEAIFDSLANKEPFKNSIVEMLGCHLQSHRITAARIICKYYNAIEVVNGGSISTSEHADGYFLLIKSMEAILEPPSLVSAIPEYIRVFDFQSIRRFKGVLDAIQSYLGILHLVDLEMLVSNILLFISMDVPWREEIAEAVYYLQGNNEYSKRIAEVVKKNACSLIANSGNLAYEGVVMEVCMGNIRTGRYLTDTIRALSLLYNYKGDAGIAPVIDKEITNKIRGLLDDYSLGATGDAGFPNRRESLLYFLCHPASLGTNLENWLIRYLADKSQKLRELILMSLLECKYPEYLGNFTHIRTRIGRCSRYEARQLRKLSSCATSDFYDKFALFLANHAVLTPTVSSEAAYFTALAGAFGLDNENIHIGLLYTLSTAPGERVKVIMNLVDDKIAVTAAGCLKEGSACLYPALVFFAELKKKGIEISIRTELENLLGAKMTNAELVIYKQLCNIMGVKSGLNK